MIRIARCCCQACEIEVEGEPVLNAICHCDNCKRRTGSAFGWSTYFADSQVLARRGPMSVYESRGATPANRFFCSVCGTTLCWASEAFMPGNLGVAGGCFTQTPLGEPSVTASSDKRCAWVGLPERWLSAP